MSSSPEDLEAIGETPYIFDGWQIASAGVVSNDCGSD